jgi:hypothetical protein
LVDSPAPITRTRKESSLAIVLLISLSCSIAYAQWSKWERMLSK